MLSKRGAMIVLEGCDRAGKSTQAELLTKALKGLQISVETRYFPDRKTIIGAVLSEFLEKDINMQPEAAHLLFSANRWESKKSIERELLSGTTLIVDRYVASGAVYAAVNTGRSLNWCQQPDVGLPKPDCVVFLEVSKQHQKQRSKWGNERFECDEFQQHVHANYEKLKNDTWITVNGDRDELTIHTEILQKVLSVIEEVQYRNIELLPKIDIN